MSGPVNPVPVPFPSPDDRHGPGREPAGRSHELLAVARGLLRSGGLAGLSMARIAEKAGCSRPAVYQYFRNKEEVVVALAIESAGLRSRLYERVPTFAARTRERVVALAEVDSILYPEWPVLEETTYASTLQSRANEARQKKLRSSQRVAYESHLEVVRDAIAAGDLNLGRSVTAQQLVFTLATFSTGLFAPVSRGLPDLDGGTSDPRPAMHRFGSAFLDGLGWKPLSTEWDYRKTLKRVYTEVFPADFLEELGLASSRTINQARPPSRRRAADSAQE